MKLRSHNFAIIFSTYHNKILYFYFIFLYNITVFVLYVFLYIFILFQLTWWAKMKKIVYLVISLY